MKKNKSVSYDRQRCIVRISVLDDPSTILFSVISHSVLHRLTAKYGFAAVCDKSHSSLGLKEYSFVVTDAEFLKIDEWLKRLDLIRATKRENAKWRRIDPIAPLVMRALRKQFGPKAWAAPETLVRLCTEVRAQTLISRIGTAMAASE